MKYFSNTGLALGNGSITLPGVDSVLEALKKAPGDPNAGVTLPVVKFILDDDGKPAFGSGTVGDITILPAKFHWGNDGVAWVLGRVANWRGTWPRMKIVAADSDDESKGQFSPEIGAKILVGLLPDRAIGEVSAYYYGADVIEPASMAGVVPGFEDPNAILDIPVPSGGIAY